VGLCPRIPSEEKSQLPEYKRERERGRERASGTEGYRGIERETVG